MERHHRLQPHVQKLLGALEIPRCFELHSRASLGIRRRTLKNSPSNFPSKQSEQCADRTTWWTVGRSLGCQQDPEYDPRKVILASGKKLCRLVVPAVRHLYSQSRPPNEGLGQVHWCPVRCRRVFPLQ
jgi:hypothetical protein